MLSSETDLWRCRWHSSPPNHRSETEGIRSRTTRAVGLTCGRSDRGTQHDVQGRRHLSSTRTRRGKRNEHPRAVT